MNDWQRIEFEVPGKVRANQRHRTGKGGRTYTPKETVEYRNWIKACFLKAQQEQGWKFTEGPVAVRITVEKRIPKSYPQWKVDAILAGKYLLTTKPDCDNIAKGVLDSLNKIAFNDDSQVFELSISKHYSDQDRIVVTFESIPQPETAKEFKR